MADLETEDDRSVELSTIAAIYPEIQIDPASPFRASLELPVTLPSPTRFCFERPLDPGLPAALTPPTSVDGNKAELDPAAARDVHFLLHLPPLSLQIELSEGYPAEKPPVVHLSTNPPWLPTPTLDRLTHDCKRLWEECGQDMVVFTYIDHIQQQAESAFGIQDTPDGELCLSEDLKIALLEFNNKTERERFEKETFECGVCLEPKKGAICYRLQRCSHVFCVSCLQDFYNTCIEEGDVDSVKCLAPDCDRNRSPAPLTGAEGDTPRRKKRRTLSPSELLQIPIAPETVKRYVFLRRKKQIEADKTTVYCPRQWCQGAARSNRHPKPADPMADEDDASDDDEGPAAEITQLPPVEDRLAICEDCGYAFCSICRKGWHGEIVRCIAPRRQEELSEEEKATQHYLALYTTPCPHCNVPCQKQMGCNHMRCFQCDAHFCYLCSSWLDPSNPYLHFNRADSSCYNRLWELEGGDGLDPDGAEALHQVPPELIVFDDEDDIDDELDEAGDDSDGGDYYVWENGDENDHIHLPPPPAPVPPPAPRDIAREAGPNGRPADPAARAAALERQAQANAIAEIRRRQAGERPIRRDGVQREIRDFHAGLQHFLELVQNDREDEWDSDELDDLDDEDF
ncbi:hypothetical protein N7532_002528 [Penicillium argentinense]|uniref:RBR-type E3 ubiquitin transferase n=1 Tax=Penicillium argentinense TaxID=1131581 RepID=A0A9W9G0K5_9EURO|nr:uncharacterized protein N7532_002528 [Penicillium argentinense]KAJ5109883.1 hypothetical protein N7532_002528 [Penicillium argentinense]